MNDEQLLKKALRSIENNAKKREVVMYGKHSKVQASLMGAGIKINKIFTGNLKLLEDKSMNYIHNDALNGKSKEYFVIIPFFLDDRGASQRETMKNYGYKEEKDYIFYPEEKRIDKVDCIAPQTLISQISALREQLVQTNSRLEELKKVIALNDTQNKMMLWQAMTEKDEAVKQAKIRFFMSIPKATGTLRHMQLAGVVLLVKFDEVCRANGLTYWLSFGTLLGAVRHKGFIPWDDDTDVCMMRGEAEKLSKIVEDNDEFYISHLYGASENNMNHCIQFRFRTKNTPYCLDIFIYDYCDNISSENVNRQIQLNAELASKAQPIRTSNLSAEEKTERYKELLENYLEISRKTVGTTNEPKKYMIWALDNLRCKAPHQSNCAISSIMPLKPVEFEGKQLMAPCNAEEYLTMKYGDIYSLPSDMLTHIHFHLDIKREEILDGIIKKYGDLLK